MPYLLRAKRPRAPSALETRHQRPDLNLREVVAWPEFLVKGYADARDGAQRLVVRSVVARVHLAHLAQRRLVPEYVKEREQAGQGGRWLLQTPPRLLHVVDADMGLLYPYCCGLWVAAGECHHLETRRAAMGEGRKD